MACYFRTTPKNMIRKGSTSIVFALCMKSKLANGFLKKY